MAEGRFLQEAARFQKTEIVTHLLDHKKELNLQDEDNRTLMHYAAWFGNVDMVKRLRKAGFLVTAVDKYGMTPLHHAAFQGCAAVVRELISYDDIELNPQDNEGRTPIRMGVGSPEVVEILAKNDEVLVNAPDTAGQTPLHFAAQWNYPKSIEALLKRDDIEVNAVYGRQSWTPFQLAGYYKNGKAAGELLKAKNLQVDLTNKYDFKAMEVAITAGYREVAREFLRKYIADYYNRREQGDNYTSFFGRALGYSKEPKLTAANFLLKNFDNIAKLESLEGYQSHEGALNQGEVGKVYTLLKK